MSLHNYIEKLRAKPVRERERIAVIATAVGFAVIFLIWIVSFNEMNKPAEQPVDQTSASLNDLKNNFQTGKDSIQNMMQQLPNQTGAAGTGNSAGNAAPAPEATLQNPVNSDNNQSVGSDNNQPVNSASPDQKNNGVPQLP
jgi:hypothetical protein